MATQSERIAALEEGIGAILAHLGGKASNDDDTETTTTKGNAGKSGAVKVPTHTVKDDDGTSIRFTQAYESRNSKGEVTTKYNSPRVLIERKAKGDDDFRKVTTLPPSVLAAIQAIPAGKVDAFQTDAREA